MSGSRRHRSMLGYYEYFMPGIYDYPVTHSAAATFSAYNMDPILASGSSPWSIPSATYVAGPLGVINYLSDVQSHLALPISQNLGTGLIYTAIGSNNLDSYPHHSLHHYAQMEEDEGYGYEDTQLDLCLAHLISASDGEEEQVEESDVDQSGDSQSSSKSYSSVEITEQSGSGESVEAEEVPRRQRKSSRRRIYEAEQGYLVEEPSSELSEEDPEELPPKSRT